MIKSLDCFLTCIKACMLADTPEDNLALMRIISQLLYFLTRFRIFGLDGMRKKICDKVADKFAPLLEKYKEVVKPEDLPESESQAYLQSRIMHITFLLTQNKKKDVIAALKDLFPRYPKQKTLLYYYLKVKYTVSLNTKKPVKQAVFANFQNYIKQNDPQTIKKIITTQYLYDEIQQLLHTSLKERAMALLCNFAKAVFHISDRIDTSFFHQFILSQYLHFLNRREIPEEQTHCSYRKVVEVMVGRTEGVTFDSDQINQRVVKPEVIRDNPFLAYAAFESMDGKKCLSPGPDDNPKINFYEVLNRGLGIYRPNAILNQFWIILYGWVKKYYEDKDVEDLDPILKKKLHKKIEKIDKKQSYLNGTYVNWLSKKQEILNTKQKKMMDDFKAAVEIQEKKDSKERVELSSKHIIRSFKKFSSRLISIMENIEEKAKKQSKSQPGQSSQSSQSSIASISS